MCQNIIEIFIFPCFTGDNCLALWWAWPLLDGVIIFNSKNSLPGYIPMPEYIREDVTPYSSSTALDNMEKKGCSIKINGFGTYLSRQKAHVLRVIPSFLGIGDWHVKHNSNICPKS